MKKLNIEITRAALTGFEVKFNDEGLPDVTATIMLMTEEGKEVTTHHLRTDGWREENKFTLPLVMIEPIQRIAAALEEVVVDHLRDGQLALGSAPEQVEISDDTETFGFGLVDGELMVSKDGELDIPFMEEDETNTPL